MTVSSVITGLQIITTAAIILVPVLANHPVNPLQKRANKALNRLQNREDDIFELFDYSKAIDDPESEGDFIFNKMVEFSDMDIDNFDEVDVELVGEVDLETGYLERGDPGFSILLDAISSNRTLDKSGVAAIGMMYGDVEILESFQKNSDMPQGSKLPIGPNAAIFVDYEEGGILNPELITYYPESPSLTLSLHELEIWVNESIRRKSHYVVVVLTLIWTTSSLLSTAV
ncbi:hypothetical protein PM032_08445 [Halorubrum ezzemoulense]|uniref:hypothetical protein n=1 Tax=Halorubrum ezzemoulense TaxID=337243 RepID=UPI00232EBBCA|nr:hypothetical protein [Halorubrum ezzemoulense]MDB2271052.1 hypothetical protein [Halorubrum ezzemoulense]